MKRAVVALLMACYALAVCGCKRESDQATAQFPASLTVAAAADLKFVLDDFLIEYQANHPGMKVDVSYGSSGNFHAQIRNGAPFDLYFSADKSYTKKLADEGFALDDNVFLYAVGRIVLWVPDGSPIDLEKLQIASLEDPAVKKIAIANPEHAPYGRAAVAALQSLGVYEQAKPKLVYGENIAQTAQFVESGAADIGVIALSLAVAPQMKGKGRYWEIPLDAYPTMEQGGIILAKSNNHEAARELRDSLLGERGREMLKRYGFLLPTK